MSEKKIIKISEVSEITGFTEKTIYGLVHARRIPFLKLGGYAVRFDRDSINEWIEKSRVEPISLGK